MTSITENMKSPSHRKLENEEATLSPSFSPTLAFTLASISNAYLIIDPLSPMDEKTVQLWEEGTDAYYEYYYNSVSSGSGDIRQYISNLTVTTTLISQTPPYQQQGNRQRRQRGRGLSSSTVLTYTQELQYRTADGSILVENIIEKPLLFTSDRIVYRAFLQDQNTSAFDNVDTVSNVRFLEEAAVGATPDAMIITFAVLCAVAGVGLMAAVLCFYRREKGAKKEAKVADPIAGSQVEFKMTDNEDMSTLDASSPHYMSGGGVLPNAAFKEYEEKSLSTIDYDYSSNYGTGHSKASYAMSSIGGGIANDSIHTFRRGESGGEPPQSTLIEEDIFSSPKGNSLLADDFSFIYSEAESPIKDKQFDILAPPGKLGVVIDTPDDGSPIVYTIKEDSVLKDKVKVGDQIIAVDNENVQTWTAIRVSKFISSKSFNPVRKITLARSPGVM